MNGKIYFKCNIEWSNISGEYKEDITDWQRLCIPCHRKYDNTGVKTWITHRKNIQAGINEGKI